MKKILLGLLLLLFLTELKAVTYVYFQNNSSLNFSISRVQYGTHIMSPGEWGFSGTNIIPWQMKTEMMWTNRNQGVHNGDDFFFDVTLRNGTDSFKLKLHLNGNFAGSDMWQSASGPGFSHGWFGDRNFHTASFSMGGKQFTLKYKAVFTGGDDDIEYALQEENPWPVLASDTADANVFNVLAYNIYMLTPPIAYTDQNERAAEIYKHIHGYDAIIFSEAFYNDARDNDLIPSIMAEYPYRTAVVDQGTFNDDGGVFIASRWPIDTSAQIVFADCNGTDCLAAKGVMYAKIRKHGRAFHLFGSHTQAWNDPQNVATRILQFLQMNDFISSLNIPDTEPVIIGGDLNVDKILNNLNEYPGMLDTLDVLEPVYLGNPNTYDGNLSFYTDPYFEYLDYVFTKNNHFSPYSATNEVVILRSVADPLWDIFDLSDHFAVRGRFVFPFITVQPLAQDVCEGEEIVMTTGLSTAATYQWYKNGIILNGAQNDTLLLSTTNLADIGVYYCVITYNNGQIVSDAVNINVRPRPATPVVIQVGDYFYSNLGPQYNHQWYINGQPIAGATDTFHHAIATGIYSLQVDSQGCLSGISDSILYTAVSVGLLPSEEIRAFPNPFNNEIFIENTSDIETIILTDLQGRKLKELNSVKSLSVTVDTKGLPAAPYLIKIYTDKGYIRTLFLIKKE
jgi:endonuclease/exonuclease/phosphatase (EEP) superfamily protein YafD